MIKKENIECKYECKYCKSASLFKKVLLSDDLPIKVNIDSDYLLVTYNGIHEAFKINYCPICGKKIKNDTILWR